MSGEEIKIRIFKYPVFKELEVRKKATKETEKEKCLEGERRDRYNARKGKGGDFFKDKVLRVSKTCKLRSLHLATRTS